MERSAFQDSGKLEKLAAEVGARLCARDLRLAAAESCTGGMVAQAVTAIPGSSAWFDCGFVTYSNEAKRRLLDVSAALLESGGPGAVSEETVRAMAAGAIANSRANVAVAVSGIAGPAGASADKPVGTVWLAWRWERRDLPREKTRGVIFQGDRARVRGASTLAALEGLLALLE